MRSFNKLYYSCRPLSTIRRAVARVLFIFAPGVDLNIVLRFFKIEYKEIATINEIIQPLFFSRKRNAMISKNIHFE